MVLRKQFGQARHHPLLKYLLIKLFAAIKYVEPSLSCSKAATAQGHTICNSFNIFATENKKAPGGWFAEGYLGLHS